MPRGASDLESDSARRIKALRRYLKLSRALLAAYVGVTEATITAWERGTETPSANFYLKLGNLAGEPSCWFFWEQAGLYSGDFMRVLPAVRLEMRPDKRPDLQIVHAGSGERLFSRPQLHAIPLLPLKAASYGGEGDKSLDFDSVPPQGLIAAPSHWAPNPAFTSCLRVHGDSMMPVLRDGYIIVVDTSETDLTHLADKMVIAWHVQKGITVSWLKKIDGREALCSESAEYSPVMLTAKNGWRVIGKVIWWIGRDG